MKDSEIENVLLQWDAKHTSLLINLYQQNRSNYNFIDEIIVLYAASVKLQHATSWLIKHYVDNGNTLTEKQLEAIFSNVKVLEHWESKLHILQLISQQNLPDTILKNLEPFIRENLFADRKFVKAAAFQAYFEVVKLHPELKNEFKAMCNYAMTKESASVKSKIKKIISKL